MIPGPVWAAYRNHQLLRAVTAGLPPLAQAPLTARQRVRLPGYLADAYPH